MVVDDHIGRSRWKIDTAFPILAREHACVQALQVDRKRSDCSKAPRNPQKVDMCVLASSSCGDFAETQERKVDLWPVLPI